MPSLVGVEKKEEEKGEEKRWQKSCFCFSGSALSLSGGCLLSASTENVYTIYVYTYIYIY